MSPFDKTEPKKSVAIAHGCTVSAISEEDIDGIAELIDAVAYLDHNYQGHSYNLVEALFEIEDLTQNGIVIKEATGTIIGYGWLTGGADRELQMEGGVHPAWRNRGMGTLLLTWLQRRAMEWGEAHDGPQPLTVVTYSSTNDNSEHQLFEDLGFTEIQRTVELLVDLTSYESEVAHHNDLEMRPLTAYQADEIWQFQQDAIETILGQAELNREEWQQLLYQTDCFKNSWLGYRNDQLVGYILNLRSEDGSGFTERLGVAPDFADLGVDRALLRHSLKVFKEAGLSESWLRVVGPASMTVDMFRSLGYQVSNQELTYLWRP